MKSPNLALACLQLNDEKHDFVPNLYFCGGSASPSAAQAALNITEFLQDEIRVSLCKGLRKDPLQKYEHKSGGSVSDQLRLEVQVPDAWQVLTKPQGADLMLKAKPYQELEIKLTGFPSLLKEFMEQVAEHNKLKCPHGARWSPEAVPRPPLRNSFCWPRTLEI